MAGPSHRFRGEYPVAVSLAVSLGLVVLSVLGWWGRAGLALIFERVAVFCC